MELISIKTHESFVNSEELTTNYSITSLWNSALLTVHSSAQFHKLLEKYGAKYHQDLDIVSFDTEDHRAEFILRFG